MNAYDRPTDSPPITRTVIMNTGLAAAAIAGLSSCTNYGTAPVSEPSAGGTSGGATGGSSGAGGTLSVKETDIPVGSGKIFPDAQTVITQPKGGVQSVQFNMYASRLSGRRRDHHDQLPLPWQQIFDHRWFSGESPCTKAAAAEDDQGPGRRLPSAEARDFCPIVASLHLGGAGYPKAIISLRVASRRVTSAWALTAHSRRASFAFAASPLSSFGRPSA